MPAEPTYLNVQQVAQRFRVAPTTIYRMAQRGLLHGFKLGGQWRFDQALLEAWVADQATVQRLLGEACHER